MYKKDRTVTVEKNCQFEIIRDIHESKAIIAVTVIHYQAFIICFNPILLEWKQHPDFTKRKAKFSSTQKISQLITFLSDSSPFPLLEIT